MSEATQLHPRQQGYVVMWKAPALLQIFLRDMLSHI